jgi:hypothetical protein
MSEQTESNWRDHIIMKTIVKIDSQYNAEIESEESDDDVPPYSEIPCKAYNFSPFAIEPFRAQISLLVLPDDLERIKHLIQPGSYLWVNSRTFTVDLENKLITFNDPDLEPVSESDMDKWLIEHFEYQEKTSSISGHIEELHVIESKIGDRMAFIRLTEHPDKSITVFSVQYQRCHRLLLHGNHLEFVGMLESSDDGITQRLCVREINAVT